jgi:hypothetical protein
MGLDAEMVVIFKDVPDETTIKRFRFELLHRFKNILYWRSYKDDKTLEQVLTCLNTQDYPAEGVPVSDRAWDIELSCRYYGPDYERGPALEISALLMFLCRHELVESVYYGHDCGPLVETNLRDATLLLDHWLEKGRMPYVMGFGMFFKDEKDRPVCSWCDVQMAEVGGGGDKTFWRCMGCEKEVTTERTKQ